MNALRVLLAGCIVHGKMRLISPGYVLLEVAWPLFFATIAFFLYRTGGGSEVMGIYCMAGTILWGRLALGIDLPLEHPLAFVTAVPATILSIGTAGFVLAVAFVRHRAGWALGNMIEFPVWLAAGFLVPIALLPGWVEPISWALAPTWGVSAVREASSGGTPWPDIAMCLVLAAAYTALGILMLNRMLRQARERAALALA